MNETLATIAVIAATVLTLAFLIPQITKLVRTGDSAGVSTTWPALGFVSNVGWFVYMIERELWASTIAPFGMFIGYAITMWALAAKTGRDLGASYVRGAVWTALLVGVTFAAGWETLGVVLGLSYAVMLTPSIWTAYRTQNPSGVSPGTWWIGLVEAALWGYYGLFHSDAGIITFGVVGIVGPILILARYYYAVRRFVPAPA